MANGYFERGEIYWVSLGNGFSEMSVARPGLIISNNHTNSSGQVIVAFLTTKDRTNDWDVFTDATGKDSWIKCDNLTTVSTTALGKCIGVLNNNELSSVENALDIVLDLSYVDDTAVKAKEKEIAVRDIQIKELKEEIAELKTRIATAANDDIARKVEIEMWQRLYEKALDQLCSMKLTGDVALRAERKTPVVVKTEEAPAGDEPKLVDINTAKFNELRKCGMSNNIALAVIDNRPYKSVEDLKKVPGLTSIMYGIISRKVCCVVPKKPVSAPVAPDTGYETEAPSTRKANLNTMSAKEIHEIIGISMTTCYSIVGYRKKNGPYKVLEDLLDVANVYPGTIDKLRDKVEV